MKNNLAGIIVLLVLAKVGAWDISEVMFDPEGSDNMKEFVEVAGTDNLTDSVVGNGERNVSLVLARFVPGNMSLIVEEGFAPESVNCSVYIAGATIAGGLKNAGGMVRIVVNGSVVDEVSYTAEYAGGNGYSLERAGNGSWHESSRLGGSPCEENSAPISGQKVDLELQSNLPAVLYASVEYDSLFQVRNVKYRSGSSEAVNVVVEYVIMENGSVLVNSTFTKNVSSSVSGGTGLFFPDRVMNVRVCGRIIGSSHVDADPKNDAVCVEREVVDAGGQDCSISLDLEIEDDVVMPGKTVGFYNRVNDTRFPFVVRYGISEAGGGEIRNTTTENDDKKSFTPPGKGALAAYIIENSLVSVMCNNSDSHTSNRRILLVVDGDRKESSIQIVDTGIGKDKVGYVGEVIKPRVKIVRGDDDKRVVSVYVEGEKRISDPASVSVDEKFSAVTVTVPLLLKGDCSLKEGQYVLVAEGINSIAREEILVRHKACEKQEVSSGTKSVTDKDKSTSESQGSILSFYTLTRNLTDKEQVNVYGRVAGMTLSVVLTNTVNGTEVFREERSLGDVPVPKKETFAVTLGPGKNKIVLEAKSAGVVSAANLLLEVNASPKTAVLIRQAEDMKNSIREGVKYYKSPEISGFAVKDNAPVGDTAVMYEGSKVKYLNILLVMVLCLAVFAAWWRFR